MPLLTKKEEKKLIRTLLKSFTVLLCGGLDDECEQVFRTIEKLGYLHQVNKYKETLLFITIEERCGYKYFVELIEKGVDVNKVSVSGYTPLNYAAEIGNYNCLTKLIEAGADLNHFGEDIGTPLYLAAKNDHKDCLVKLIKSGCRITALRVTDHCIQYHPLIEACKQNNYEIILALIENITNLLIFNDTKIDRQTIHVAITQNNIKCVKILLTVLNANIKKDNLSLIDNSEIRNLFTSKLKNVFSLKFKILQVINKEKIIIPSYYPKILLNYDYDDFSRHYVGEGKKRKINKLM